MMIRLAGWPRRALGALGLAALIIGVFGSSSALSFATPAAPATSLLQTTTPVTAAAADPVLSDGFVTFTLSAPGVKAVSVIGSWGLSYTNVAYPMSQSGATWTVFLGPLTPGLYSYNFIVDGVATKDPNNPSVVHSNPALSTFFVPGEAADFLAIHQGPKGAVNVLTYHSNVTGTDRHATVWTPPGYSATRDDPYPTFYLVHGGGGDYLDWVQQGRANVILDNLYNARRLEPMVVVPAPERPVHS